MATTEDWNPRSLSSFSTFGGGQGSPPLGGLNGHAFHVNGTNHVTSDTEDGTTTSTTSTTSNNGGGGVSVSGLGNGGDGVGGDGNSISLLVTSGKTNGLVTVNGSTPPDVCLESPDIIPTCHKPSALKMASHHHHHHHHNNNNNHNNHNNNNPPELVSLVSTTSSITSNNSHSHTHHKPLLGTPVLPPSVEGVGVVRVRHFHSKSLAGDELGPPLPLPRHGHSRSLVENMDHLLLGPRSPDGERSREVSLFLGPTDRRFGFSVVGGVGEKFPPRIEEMAKGKY
ncbi:hypothetical protein Pcinc_013616 [Petrolisthes cinctipes]|uniref:Uncharacterized protein n=1 Tax=Petrolisthes cinctipes TaxID=88211 RepID=A0AAE1KSK7_PETCI|nr:hypothetical protein Pcinc_013616 [Petrolisthes cinctipes]